MMSTIGRKVGGARVSRSGLMALIAGAALGVAALAPAANQLAKAAAGEPATLGGPPGFRRLNEGEYLRSIEQIFGPGLKVPGRFDPPLRDEGLMAIGDGKVVVSPSGVEQYELRAREIAAQVMSPERRGKVLACSPASATAFDQQCASEFLGK